MKCNCDETSAANVAGLNYSLSNTEGKTVVDIRGFNQKQSLYGSLLIFCD